jgi:hypothetical protein
VCMKEMECYVNNKLNILNYFQINKKKKI